MKSTYKNVLYEMNEKLNSLKALLARNEKLLYQIVLEK